MNNDELLLPISLDEITLPQKLPPIVLVAFTRPELLKQVLSSLSRQSLLPQHILAFVDGQRSAQDEPLIQKCVGLLEEFSKYIPVEIFIRPHNLGCDKNVISALTEVLSRYSAVVYLEDDVVPNSCFYDRMCRLLEAYTSYKKVFSVSAYANFPEELEPLIAQDFLVSNRVFTLGLGLWADRWNELNLVSKPQGYNPFGNFYNIPATIQTKYTIVNQFFIEKNNQTDWVITMTLGALFNNRVHIIPKASFVQNIGFGSPESKNYKGAEPSWFNSRYDPSAYPNSLPCSLEPLALLTTPLDGKKLVQHFKQNGLWLSLSDMWHFLWKYPGWHNMASFLTLSNLKLVRFLVR